MKNTTTLVFVTSALALMAGCSSAPTKPPVEPTVAAAPAVAPSAPAKPSPTVAPAPAAIALPAYLDPKSPVYQQRSVYFDFDSYVARADAKPVIETQGTYLASMPALRVRIEGNTDERGSTEYNLALGQRRAESVQRALKVYGVKESQMEAVSYGKEKPKATAHNEAAWSQNRRADVVYPSK